MDHVKKKEAEKLKTYEALQKENGDESTNLAWTRIRLYRAIHAKLHQEIPKSNP